MGLTQRKNRCIDLDRVLIVYLYKFKNAQCALLEANTDTDRCTYCFLEVFHVKLLIFSFIPFLPIILPHNIVSLFLPIAFITSIQQCLCINYETNQHGLGCQTFLLHMSEK